jgi:hypothetical protein
LVLTLACGVLTGAALAYLFGSWLKPAPPQNIPTVGRLDVLRMPIGARKLKEIRSFVLRGGGDDDFGRIFVNNYLVNSSETPRRLFTGDKTLAAKRNAVIGYAVNRHNDMPDEKDVRVFLRPGKNYIVKELENSIYGTCVAGGDIIVNGVPLEQFPENMPEDWFIEKAVRNPDLVKRV